MIRRQVRIAHGHSQARVAENLLQGKDVATILNEVTGESVPKAMGGLAFGYPCQDPLLHLGVDPADATVAQRDRLREGALPDIPVDGRSG